MTDRTPEISRLIDYEALTLEALRGVARRALEQVAAEGLPGDHHFYVEFDTAAAGVEIPEFLRARYPARMNIVLQHQFSGLQVEPGHFRVRLVFGGIPATLTIPFAALTAFADPAAQFAVRFGPEAPTAAAGDRAEPRGAAAARDGSASEEAAAHPDGVVSLAAFRNRRSRPPPPDGEPA